MLLVLVLLGLLVAMFSFRVNADLASTRAISLRTQTRLAAEAGIDRVKLLLREARFDRDRWYDNLEELHRIIVWSSTGDRTEFGSNEEFDDGRTVFRFSIVADDPTDDEERIRIGITDESAKLNLNKATAPQLLILLQAAVGDDPELDPQVIVDSIVDWRDADATPSGEATDSEGEFYRSLPKPYKIKNGPFDTVEELLLVKGVTGQILYGEDFDRNGLLTDNENDGDLSFPPDNQDGKLNRGLYPYVTVWSKEDNVANDNRPRVYLLGDAGKLTAELETAFPDDPDLVAAIAAAAKPPAKGGKKNPDKPGAGGQGGAGGDKPGGPGGDKDGGKDGGKDGDAAGGGVPGDDAEHPEGDGSEGQEPGGGSGEEGDGSADATGDEGTGGDKDQGGKGSGGDGKTPTPITSPAALFKDRVVDGQPQPSQLGLEQLAAVMDRTTTVAPDKGPIPALININTAPPLVLSTIDGLTEEQIGKIVEMRDRLGPDALATTAWLVTEGVLDIDAYAKVAPAITARGQQFTIESLGYADDKGMITRLQVIVDMSSPIAQTIYYRDVSYVGSHFPIRQEDLEKLRVR